MRILHIVPTYFPATRYGGPIYAVHGLCKALVGLGHEVHVYTTNVDGSENSNVPLGSAVDMEGVNVWYFPCTMLRRIYWSPPMKSRLKKTIGNFDVVHLHSVFLWPTLMGARMARRSNIPYVVSPRGMLVADLIRRKSRMIKSLWIRVFEKKTLKDAALIHVTSRIEGEEIERLGFDLPELVPIHNGYEPQTERINEPLSEDVRKGVTRQPYLLFLGRLNWKKGLDRLLSAMPADPAVNLVIAGNDEEGYRKVVDELILKHGLNDRVWVIDRFVRDGEKNELYRQAKLFVLPSYSENFGNTVVEALAAGCPVLVTEEVGAKEVVIASGGGAVCTAADLAPTLEAMLADETGLQEKGESGRRWVEENLAWRQVASQMEQAYRTVLIPGVSC